MNDFFLSSIKETLFSLNSAFPTSAIHSVFVSGAAIIFTWVVCLSVQQLVGTKRAGERRNVFGIQWRSCV